MKLNLLILFLVGVSASGKQVDSAYMLQIVDLDRHIALLILAHVIFVYFHSIGYSRLHSGKFCSYSIAFISIYTALSSLHV